MELPSLEDCSSQEFLLLKTKNTRLRKCIPSRDFLKKVLFFAFVLVSVLYFLNRLHNRNSKDDTLQLQSKNRKKTFARHAFFRTLFENNSQTSKKPYFTDIIKTSSQNIKEFVLQTHADDTDIPDVKDQETVLGFAEMASSTYDLVDNTTSSELPDILLNNTFGWDSNELRGYIFVSSDAKNAVIAFKGTSAKFFGIGGTTSKIDKENDNNMFSCCCADIDLTWTKVCDCSDRKAMTCNSSCLSNHAVNFKHSYFAAGSATYEEVKANLPGAKIWLTGHSLGGAFASLVAAARGLAAVTYETPGERRYAALLGLDVNSKYPIYHFGHNADPIFTGACNHIISTCYMAGYAMETHCHIGKTCLYDIHSDAAPEPASHWTTEILHHRIKPVITDIIKPWKNGPPECVEDDSCVDCENWNFS